MGELSDLMQAFLAGLGCGFVVSVPVGPVNVTVINNALRKGFLPAFLAGLGAIVAESFYAALMLAGHSSLLDRPMWSLALRVVAVAVMAGMGVRSLLAKPERFEAQSAATAERTDERWHHPRAFLLGFVLTISNLMLVILWATLAAFLFAREWVGPGLVSRSVCLAGVFTGGTVWFFLLAFFVSRAHHRVKPRTLAWLVRACGVILLICASLLAYRLVVPAKKLPAVDLLRHTS